jgi:NAD(P)-dependent dehydrogenase (short-subunit alcohol dehydrogenase family)
VGIVYDAANPKSRGELLTLVITEFGKIDIPVNSAGIYALTPVMEVTGIKG